MFSFCLRPEFFIKTIFTPFVFLAIITICFVEAHRRSYDEYQSITDPDLLSKQYSLVNQFGGVDILGDIRQYKNGKIDSRDFGQNVHFNYRDNIRPGEKEQALNELTQQGLKTAIKVFHRLLEEWLA